MAALSMWYLSLPYLTLNAETKSSLNFGIERNKCIINNILNFFDIFRGLPPPPPPPPYDILDMVSDMYATWLAYNTTASAKSVLSCIIHLPGLTLISDHPLVQRLLRCVLTRPP